MVKCSEYILSVAGVLVVEQAVRPYILWCEGKVHQLLRKVCGITMVKLQSIAGACSVFERENWASKARDTQEFLQ